ncbi:MAG: hypothetical protein BRD49_04580 [Bacteroidetes bacterium SW_10_40_5]|nr:MAG: hypothetical protein BRD49_04580 [Bacteroidetes bacterium SW_10_40_5]
MDLKKQLKYLAINSWWGVLVIFLVFNVLGLKGQNLVPNGNFEQFNECPGERDHYPLKNVKAWQAPAYENDQGNQLQHSPDFFHICSQGKYGNPENYYGIQEAKKGKGYAGIYVHKVLTREYLFIQLDSTLKKGHHYQISCAISLSDRCLHSINKLSAAFTKNKEFQGIKVDALPLVIKDQEGKPQMLDEQENWLELSANFKADGQMQYLILGNFYPKDSIKTNWVSNDTEQPNLKKAYYYVDDVTVQPCKTKDCKELKSAKASNASPTQQKLQAAKEELEAGNQAKLTLEDIYFSVGKSKILPASYSGLKEMTRYLKQNENLKVKVEGYTDNTGRKEANLALSKERAKAVANYLLEHGIAQDRISYEGYGAANPVATNKTESGRQENRRVEISLKKISQ